MYNLPSDYHVCFQRKVDRYECRAGGQKLRGLQKVKIEQTRKK